MRFNKKTEKSTGNHFISILFSFVLVFLIVFLIVSNVKVYQRRVDVRIQMQEKEKEVAEFSQEVETNDYPEEYSLEKIIREQLLMRKKGEEVVYVSFPETDAIEEEKDKGEFFWWNPLTWKFK
jgi:hypothetical protein